MANSALMLPTVTFVTVSVALICKTATNSGPSKALLERSKAFSVGSVRSATTWDRYCAFIRVGSTGAHNNIGL